MLKLAGVLLLVLASSFNPSIGALLPNGDFENEPTPTQLSGTKVEGKYAIPHWESEGFVEYIKSGTKQGDMVLVVPEGKHAVRLGNGASIKQTIAAQKGKFYALTFSFARTCSQDEVLNVTVTPDTGKHDTAILPLQTMYSSVGFDSYGWGFVATSNIISIHFLHPEDDDEDPSCGPLIDTVGLNLSDRPTLTRGNLIKNGDFGQGPYMVHSSTWGVLIPPNIEDSHSPLPGWMIESLKAVKYIDSLHFAVPEGQRAVELVGGKESALAQTIRTIPGWVYHLTFLVGDAKNGCVGPLAVEAFAGKATTTVSYQSKGKGGFVMAKLGFVAESRRTRIRFYSTFYTMTVDGSMCGPVIDDVKVVPTRASPRFVGKVGV